MKFRKRHAVRHIQIVLICTLILVLGLAVVRCIAVVLELRRPFVDLSRRAQPVEWPDTSADDANRLRFAVAAMVCLEDTFSTYKQLIARICRSVGYGEAFVLRPSYAEVRHALEQGEVDVAFVCTGTYVHSLRRGGIKLLVQPEFLEGLEYRSLLIVPQSSSAQRPEDLAGSVIAFTDPESNTGCLVPSAMFADRGIDANKFFEKIVFTGSHDRSIIATGLGTIGVAAVDSLVLDSMTRRNSPHAGRVKVIWESQPFGPPPIVVPVGIDESLEKKLQEAFVTLDQDDQGREILSNIGIKRFIPAREQDYRSVVQLYRRFQLKDAAK